MVPRERIFKPPKIYGIIILHMKPFSQKQRYNSPTYNTSQKRNQKQELISLESNLQS